MKETNMYSLITKSLRVALIPILVLYQACSIDYDGKSYHKHYEVGKIPDWDVFEEVIEKGKKRLADFNREMQKSSGNPLSPEETSKEVDSLIHDLSINGAAVFMREFRNGKARHGDTSFEKGFPAKCNCVIKSDTLYIGTGIGFFGGIGFGAKVFGDDFSSFYSVYTDDVEPYKSNLKDSIFRDYAVVDGKFQYLIMNKKPKFKVGEEIKGFLSMTSRDYYEQISHNTLDTLFAEAKIYFTCKVQSDNQNGIR